VATTGAEPAWLGRREGPTRAGAADEVGPRWMDEGASQGRPNVGLHLLGMAGEGRGAAMAAGTAGWRTSSGRVTAELNSLRNLTMACRSTSSEHGGPGAWADAA
jgi:hypothetical protein